MQGKNAHPAMMVRGRRGAWGIVLGLVASLAIASAAQAKTYVSFTFDDGAADQYAAGAIFAKHGMKATFYVNSGQVGTSRYYMSWDQLRELYRAGHEIGGHTLHHTDSSTQTAEQQRADVCQDRSNLLAQGFAATSFAYSFGSSNVTRAVLQGCGYNSGQLGGGLRWGSTCTRCPRAATLPPEDPYAIRSIEYRSSMTAEQMAGYISQTEAAGGGWLIFPFNRLCDGCSEYSIAPAQLTDFVERVQALVAKGDAEVVTVQQAVGGELQPVPPGTSPRGGDPSQPDGAVPPPPPGSGITVASRDTLAPVIVSLYALRSKFAVGKKPTALTAAVRRGTTLRYVVSEPGRVVFRVRRAMKGRRVGRSCRPVTWLSRNGRPCTRYKTVGTLSRATTQLTNRMAFSGRVGNRALRPGRYRIVAQAIDAAGNKSRTRAVGIKVLSARRR